MTLFPIHAIAWTVDIHLLLECNRAAPCFEIDHRNTKPSFTLPKEQSQRVSGEKARESRPKLLCSFRTVSGTSDPSSAIEKILILGL